MTLCELITNPITRLEKEGKDLDQIAKEVCPEVKYGREKIIRIIKDFLGEDYLIDHAKTLKYDVQKAQLAKRRIRGSIREQKKIDTTSHSNSENKGACQKQCDKEPDKKCSEQEPKSDKPMVVSGLIQEPVHDFDELVKEVRRLVGLFSLEDVRKALVVVGGIESKKQSTD